MVSFLATRHGAPGTVRDHGDASQGLKGIGWFGGIKHKDLLHTVDL